jgi:glutaconyl-CoA/methylmalonyl-CoA decarboxylase subunit delta
MENLEWGLKMTVLGMGLVFALLGLLWGLLTLVLMFDKEAEEPVSALDATAQAERIAVVAAQAVGAQVPEPATVNGMAADLVAAILVATMKHRLTLRREAAPLMRSIQPGRLHTSRWVAAGRARQTTTWQPRGK